MVETASTESTITRSAWSKHNKRASSPDGDSLGFRSDFSRPIKKARYISPYRNDPQSTEQLRTVNDLFDQLELLRRDHWDRYFQVERILGLTRTMSDTRRWETLMRLASNQSGSMITSKQLNRREGIFYPGDDTSFDPLESGILPTLQRGLLDDFEQDTKGRPSYAINWDHAWTQPAMVEGKLTRCSVSGWYPSRDGKTYISKAMWFGIDESPERLRAMSYEIALSVLERMVWKQEKKEDEQCAQNRAGFMRSLFGASETPRRSAKKPRP